MPSNTTIQRNLRWAKAASEFSNYPKYKLGAVLVQGNKVIAIGWNSTKTNPTQKRYNAERGYDQDVKHNGMVHAEMDVLNKTKFMTIDYSKTALYIYRCHKDGSPALAKPCPACAKAIKERGITQVYYTTENISFEKFNF